MGEKREIFLKLSDTKAILVEGELVYLDEHISKKLGKTVSEVFDRK